MTTDERFMKRCMQWQNSTYDRQRGYKFYYDKLNRLTSAIYDEDTSGSNIQGLIKGEKVTANKTNELSALRSKFERIATSVQPYEAEPLLEAIAEIDEDCQECVMEEDSLQLQDFEATENLNNNIACYDEYVEYDLNGNITSLQRYGRMQDDTFGTIDDLHVSLNGNQLSSVTDEAARVVSEGAIDFNNADDGQSEYTYNACGSLTSDTGRGIAMIEYDNCNNPMRIQFTSGNVTKYVYTADGQKLRTIYYTAMPNITVPIGETKVLEPAEILCVDSVDYMLGGSLILRNGRMDKYLFDEGYCQAKEPFCCIAKPVMFTGFFDEEKGEFISSVPTEEERKIYQELCERWGKAMEAIRNSDEFTFYYYNKDHLGNIREVVNDMGQINQVTNYYPFGSPYCDIQSTINPEFQPFKYNGKELDMMHGLNAYDYGARQYYSPLPVWDRIDPLAEKYYNVSPYAYCNNNPVNAVDPDGRGVWLFATKLPGTHIPFATHTFLVVTGDNGTVLRYAAYGPQNGNPFGGDKLAECSYQQDQQVYMDFFNGKNNENLKGQPQKVNVPKGMTSKEFDNKVIQTINSFGNKNGITYTIFGGFTDKTKGNCNTSSSTILIKSGVGKKEMKSLESNIEGINTGFQTTEPKPWTKNEQEKALEEKKKMDENKRFRTL